jgi:LmbE family N-acetylglucosaminyl deacetylase
MPEQPLRLLIIGAHPDDADFHAGGLAALYRQAGHAVKMVSLTNGDAGHHVLAGVELAKRRRAEAAAAGAVIGASYEVFDNRDGELLPSLENRRLVIRLIRTFRPDLVLTHRPNDYHPDHRYTSMLVSDAAYMVTVPAIVPNTPHLSANPVIAYLPDHFQKPYPFQPSVGVDVGGVMEQIVNMLHCHASQVYEWLPYNGGYLDEVPFDDAARRQWLIERVRKRRRAAADRFQESLQGVYGTPRGGRLEYLEAFEACEYGAPLDEAAKKRLFGFLTPGAG